MHSKYANQSLTQLKILFIISLLLACTVRLQGQTGGTMITIKNGYFVPLRGISSATGRRACYRGSYFCDGVLRTVFGDYACFEINGSYSKYYAFSPDRGSDFFIHNHQHCTAISFPALGLGLSYGFFMRDSLQWFIGGGIRFFFLKIEHPHEHLQHSGDHHCWRGVGGAGQTRLVWDPGCNILVELFADYLGKTFNHSVGAIVRQGYCFDLGGIATGIGLSYQF